MPILSAIEDLKNSTLRSIEGMLAKLEYFARRRRPNGTYEHWGLARVHGDSAAQQAMAEAHRAALAGVLRTPLRDLAEDTANQSQQAGVQVSEYVEKLSSRAEEALPAEPGAGAARHFRSVLKALSLLLRRR
jgi:hypothetical protein